MFGGGAVSRDRLEFRLLGPVQARCGGHLVDLGVRKRRFVLAVLALEANRMVTLDRLVDLVWPDDPPASARGVIRGHISGLRATLVQSGAAEHGIAVHRDGPGYVLACDPTGIDAHRFGALATSARQEVDDARRVDLLDEALGLWRGPALAGSVPEHVRGLLTGHLEEAQLAAVEDRLDTLLRLNRHHGVIEQLSRLAAEHPHRPRLVELLMLALHRSGRTPEALRVYQHTKRRLADSLGLDPPAELQRLELAILHNDPDLTYAPGSTNATRPVDDARPSSKPDLDGVADRPAATAPAGVRPAQLPADIHTFTGRQSELAALLALLPDTTQSPPPPTVVVSAIDGMAGVGKTALAVHAAHRVQDRFPDGQLFLDLHGFTQSFDPVEPTDALDRMLRALGVPDEQIPHDLDDRAALYRTLLADRRVLILLDNAATEDQVYPLLPAAPGCLVLITSRRRLTGLDHTHPLSLDVLPLGETVELFTHVASRDRLTDEPPFLLEELVQLCGRLPLAIRLTAARLRARPAWNLAHLAARLRDAQNRLAELETGRRSVVSAFHLSYRHLDAAQQRVFRLLGLHPGPSIDVRAAAVLTGTTPPEVSQLLDDLLDCHLLQQPAPSRYQFHDLLRTYAAHLTLGDSEEDRRSALRRLYDHYGEATTAAMNAVYPHEADERPQDPCVAAGTGGRFGSRQDAEAWLDSELDTLLAAACAARDDWPGHTLNQSAALHRHLRTRGRHTDAAALHGHALRIAQSTGDNSGELGALNSLGEVYRMLGRYGPATESHEQALRIARDIGSTAGTVAALIGLGQVHCARGRFGPATDCLMQALRIARSTASRGGHLTALTGLGHVYRAQRRPGLAADNYQLALEIARSTGDRGGELAALAALGHARLQQGWLGLASDSYRGALQIARETADRNGQFEVLHGLGRIHLVICQHEQALGYHTQALEIAADLDQPPDQARAHDGIAHGHNGLARHDQARQHWQYALGILARLGTPTADELTVIDLRACLAGSPTTRLNGTATPQRQTTGFAAGRGQPAESAPGRPWQRGSRAAAD